MRKRFFAAAAVVAALTAVVPAAADDPTEGTVADRYVPQTPGTQKDLTYFFGPYHIPPGHDANRVTIDLPVHTGFIVSVAPDLIDATTGEEPPEAVAHIHHAHWLRVTNDTTNYEPYPNAIPLSWVFGTGEEKTQGSLDDRTAVEPPQNDWRYGIYIDGTMPQSVIYMIHNKTSAPLTVYVLLEVEFIAGTREEIKAQTGQDIHPLFGTLWGETKDATSNYPYLSQQYVATADGTAIASAGHLHPGGKEVVIANLGPDTDPGTALRPACSTDADGDGFPGTTILRSRKLDRGDADGSRGLWPWSEEYQMGASKFGWRAPIRKGDVLYQFAPYDVGGTVDFTRFNFTNGLGGVQPAPTLDGKPHAAYQAMTYTGLYVDRLQVPAARTGDICDPSHYTPTLLGSDDVATQARGLGAEYFEPGATESVLNHEWHATPEPLCGISGTPRCDDGQPYARDGGMETSTVHITGFLNLPGDMAASGPLGAPPKVKAGTSLRFVNEDAFANIRHTVTSCPQPCNGKYVANYPIPDGSFDSGKLGNFDPIDGGLTGSDTVPVWDTPTTLAPGMYTYFCRIHPFMRGAFEVVP